MSETIKEKKKGPFDYINSVSHSKVEMMRDEDGKLMDSHDYEPFVTNRALSNFPDTILFANEMNRLPHLSPDAQYRYYLNSLRPRKRYAKWPKKEKEEDFALVCEYFNCNPTIGKQYMKMLTDETLQIIRDRALKGG